MPFNSLIQIKPDDSHIATGMSDGTLSVRRRQVKGSNTPADLASISLRTGAFESILGNLPTLGQGHVKSKVKSRPIGDVDELRVESKRRKKLKEYETIALDEECSAVLQRKLPPKLKDPRRFTIPYVIRPEFLM